MSMFWIVAIFVTGLGLSAFFSGSETGFYRVTRVRLVIDGLDGDPIARGLLWLTNNPALFVATTLIGNNVANYLTSLAIVLGVGHLATSDSIWTLIAPIVASPIVFVYGELLPKNLFYYAPNKLLRAGGPFFLMCTILFAPVSAILWCFGQVLEKLSGSTPLRLRLTLARKELQQILQEGHDAGILRPSQRSLAQNLFSVAADSVAAHSKPFARVVSVKLGSQVKDVLRIAKRHALRVIPVTERDGRRIIGYVRIVDLYLSESETIEDVLPLIDIKQNETHIAAILQLQTEKAELARIVDDEGKTMGLVFADELVEPLFRD